MRPRKSLQVLVSLVALVLQELSVPLRGEMMMEIDVDVGPAGDKALTWNAMNVTNPWDLNEVAYKFAQSYNLHQGGGCSNISCVAHRLVGAMERSMIQAYLAQNSGVPVRAELAAVAATAKEAAPVDAGSGATSTKGTTAAVDLRHLASNTFLEVKSGDPDDEMWSSCGFHDSGDPFSPDSPLPRATERSEQRMAVVRANLLSPLASRAEAVLRRLRVAAAAKTHAPPVVETDYDVFDVVDDDDDDVDDDIFGNDDEKEEKEKERRSRRGRAKFDGCPASRDPAQSKIILAIGIMSAPGNLGHRMAIRRTWLAMPFPHQDLVAVKFIIGLNLGESSRKKTAAEKEKEAELQRDVVQEALAFGDVGVVDMEDHYLSTPRKVIAIFRWGVERCGAYWVLRSNDDVFLRLGPTMERILGRPPVKLYMGLVIDGASMTVPRPEHHQLTQLELYERHKTWAFTRSDYPSDAFPHFAQGNAILLSRDLAGEIADVARRPWVRLMADDVFVALLLARFQYDELIVPVDYDFHGTYTQCHDDALWQFNLHPEHMYDLFHNHILGYRKCQDIVRFCCG